MIGFGSVNYLGVVAGTIAAMVVGFIWYSRPLFGSAWMKEAGVDPKKAMKKGMVKSMGGAVVASLITNFMLDVLITSLSITTVSDALALAVVVWAGFFLGVGIVRMSFEGTSTKLFLINAAHDLVAMAVISVVLLLA